MAKDLRTRWQGVYVRHQRGCRAPDGERCSCRPGYMARVWDRSQGQQLRSPTLRTAAAASSWRSDTLQRLDRGELPDVRSELRVGKAVERFIAAAREGSALTKHGRRYKPSAIADLEGSLMVHVVPVLGGKRLSDVRRGDLQRLVDKLAPKLSGSRVRSVVNATRSLYRWAQERDHVGHNPAALIRLPAMDATPRDRVATPVEFAQLLDALELPDAVPFALAGYATARRQEIRAATWEQVDWELGAIHLGADGARKTAAALRTVPLLRPLQTILRAEYLRQGRPPASARLCPARAESKSGLVSVDGIARHARELWLELDPPLEPIGMHESRHTAASWMNAAGVNPKVASMLMGHSTPARAAAAAAGAPQLTLALYTHTLPGDVERARDQLDAYLAAAAAEAQETGS